MTDQPDYRAICDPLLIQTLASPLRQEIVDTIWALGGEATAACLAEQLSRPADGLYYHLNQLCRVGLVIEITEREDTDRHFRLNGSDNGPLRLNYRPGPSGNGEALKVYVKALLKVARQDFEQAIVAPSTVMEGKGRELWASRNKGWTTHNERQEIIKLLERLSELTSRTRQSADDRLIALTFVVAPVTKRPKRRASKS